MLAAANRPSEMRVGSQSSHCSLGIATVVLPDSRKTLRFKNEPRELLKWQLRVCVKWILFGHLYSVQVQNLIQIQSLVKFSIHRNTEIHHRTTKTNSTYVKIRDSSEPDGGHVEGVGDEVHHVPHVADVLPQPHVPQLLDL